MKQLEVNDVVKYLFDAGDYRIVADKQTPYTHEDIPNAIYPTTGNDFIIVKLPIELGIQSSFIHVQAGHLISKIIP